MKIKSENIGYWPKNKRFYDHIDYECGEIFLTGNIAVAILTQTL